MNVTVIMEDVTTLVLTRLPAVIPVLVKLVSHWMEMIMAVHVS